MINKAGPMSALDKEYIEANYKFLTIREIAKNLGRNPNTITKFLKDKGLFDVSRRVASIANVEFDIRKTPHWDMLKKQFSPDELETFMYHWNNTIKQFNDDITHLEELQVIDMIKMDIMMNRLLISERVNNLKIEQLENDLAFERDKPSDIRDYDLIKIKDDTLMGMYASKDSIGKEYRDMAARKEKMFIGLKGTRDQRLEEIESSKDTMVGWIKQLIQQPELRKKMAINMEKHRIAHIIELERLSNYHTYIDGTVDQPILTSETIKEDHYE